MVALRRELHELSDRVDGIKRQRDRLSEELTISKREFASNHSLLARQSFPSAEDSSDGLIERVGQLKRTLELNPLYDLSEFALLSDEDWLGVAKNMKKDSEFESLKALGLLGQMAKQKFLPELRTAEEAYRAKYGEQNVIDPQSLKRYLTNSDHAKILDRYEVWSGEFMGKSDWYLRERETTGLWYNSTIYVSRNGVGITSFGAGANVEGAKIKFQTEHGRNARNAEDLAPYLKTPIDEETLKIILGSIDN